MRREETELTKHAAKRMQQRGIKKELVEVIMTHADIETDIGNGTIAYSISKERLKKLRKTGDVPAQLMEKADGTCVAVANDNGPDENREAVVTILHIHGKAGRHYRKFRRCSHDRRRKWSRR